MRLVTFEFSTPNGPARRVGALLDDGGVVDLADADPRIPGDMLGLLRMGPSGMDMARTAYERGGLRYPAGEFRLLPPLPRPNSIRCFSLIEEHMLAAIETMKRRVGGVKPALTAIPPEWYNLPAYFKKNPDEVYGPENTVPWPGLTGKLDFEFELAAVVGVAGRGLTPEQAPDHIVGYTIFNDWSARDYQQREMSVNLGPGLSKDFASSIGPAIVTADEFDPATARLRIRVDGVQWNETTAAMRIGFDEVLATTSSVQTVLPGDVLTSGTVGGGAGIEFDRWISEGSVVELEAEGIGILRNVVGKRGEAVPLPPSQS